MNKEGNNMKTLIICVSVYKGNTKKIADAMADVLNAQVVKPKEIDIGTLIDYDMIGFGSGINFKKHNKILLEFVDTLPMLNKKAFIFSTRGNPRLGKYHRVLKEKLAAKDFQVIGEFSCPGFDATGPFRYLGGINKGRPNERDLFKSRDFARTLEKVAFPMHDFSKKPKIIWRKRKIITKHQGHNVWGPFNPPTRLGIHGTKVAVDWDICIGCGRCINGCPITLFDWVDTLGHPTSEKKSDPVREKDCIQCLTCETNCPTHAVKITGNFWDAIKIVWRHRNR